MYTIILVIIGIIISIYFAKRYTLGLITNVSRTTYIELKNGDQKAKGMVKSLTVVESDGRIIRLLRDSNTSMTELGWALEKGRTNLYELDNRHIGSYRDLIYKFKELTDALITETKALDTAALLEDTDQNKDIIDKITLHWEYYKKIYDKIFTEQCKNSPHVHSGPLEECYDFYKANYKDQAHEDLAWEAQDIIKNLKFASSEVSQRTMYLDWAKKEITTLFP